MVAALLVFVAMAIFQIGLALYVRNTLISSASEGARYAGRAGSSPAEGVDRTSALITSSLNPSYAQRISAREVNVGGVRAVEVTVTAPLPVLGLFGPSGSMTVSGRAFVEDQITGAAP